MTHTTIQLGNLDPKELENTEFVQLFIKSRATRSGILLTDYDVSVDRKTGTVLATRKENVTDVEINWT